MKVIRKMLIATIMLVMVHGIYAQHKATKKSFNTNGTKGIFVDSKELHWFSPMEGAPIQFATGSGDTFKTGHGTFGKFPGNFSTPMHVHSNSYQAVVISGIMTNPMKSEGSGVKKMGPGSYWYVPANMAHETKCVSKEPCVFYMYQSVPFDFTQIETKK